MQALKCIATVAIIAAWLSWDVSTVCFRTFVLGKPLSQQAVEIEEEDGNDE